MQLSSVLTTLLLAGSAGAFLAPDLKLKASDHKKLGKEVASYWEALKDKKDIMKSFEDLDEVMKGVDKKLEKEGTNILECTEDWEEIFWLANEEALDDKKLKKGKVTEADGFVYYVDSRYRSSNGPFPLVLVVTDEGQAPGDAIEELSGTAFGANAILAGLSVSPGSTGEDAAIEVMTGFGALAQTYMFGFDYDRVFLIGNGAGFAPAASAARHYGHLFAGLIGRGEIPGSDPANFRNLATYLGGGGAAGDIAKKVEELGYGNATSGADEPDAIWAWLEGRERDSYPLHVTFSPPSGTTKKSFWVSVDGIDLDSSPRIDAVANREKNEITITAEGVSTVDLFLNDALCDLDLPLKVSVNGTVKEQVLSRNARKMIERTFYLGDWASIATAEASFEVPAAE